MGHWAVIAKQLTEIEIIIIRILQDRENLKKVVRGFLKLLILPNDYSKSSGVLEIRL